jgi:hypothetical protein
MRSGLGAVLLAALPLVLATVASRVGVGTPSSAAAASCCRPTSTAGDVVGAITNVLHSKVYLSGQYVGATPFEIASGNRISTDGTGELIFDLAKSRKSVVCIVLPRTVVQVTPKDSTASFLRGDTWCSIQPTDGWFTSPIGSFRSIRSSRSKEPKPALVGVIDVRKGSAVIKVVEGSVSVSKSRRTLGVAVPQGRQWRGIAGTKPTPLRLSGDDRVAIAQLQLAQPATR